MLFAPPVVDGTRRYRYSSGSSALVPYRSKTQPIESRAQSKALVAYATQPADVGAPIDQNSEYFSQLTKMITPSLASILRPAGATRWMLPSVAAITPQYIEMVLRGALAGNHVQAWELFDIMCDTDPEIAACVGEYTDGVAAKKIIVTPYANDDEEPTDIAKQKAAVVSAALRSMRPDMANDENDLTGTIKDILSARFLGQSVLEIDWFKQDGSGLNIKRFPNIQNNDGKIVVPRSTYWVHPVCYAWDMYGRLGLRLALESQLKDALRNAPPARVDKMRSMVEPPAWSMISSQARPSQVQDFPKNKFLIGINKFKSGTVMGSGSCLRVLAWWWIASMFSGEWLLNYAQLFGIPFRKAHCSPSTPETKKAEIRQMLESMGSAGYILLDTGNELEFERATGGTGDSPQAFLFRFANEMKRKVILRQTMAGGSNTQGTGIGKGGMETEAEGAKDQCLQAGANFAASVISLQLVPSILTVNYGDDDGDMEAPSIALVDDDAGNLNDAQTLQILTNIVDVGETEVRRKFKLSKPADDEKICGKDTGAAAAKMQAAGAGGQDGQGQDYNYGGANGDQQYDYGTQNGGPGAQYDSFQSRRAWNAKRQLQARHSPAALLAGPAVQSVVVKSLAKAMSGVAAPLMQRLKEANDIKDPSAKKAALKKLLEDIQSLGEQMKKSPELAEALAKATLP
jgi:phage gp29-like protein